ncbi:MAG: hypothetical protein U0359_31210 [Byssovorax sp.]
MILSFAVIRSRFARVLFPVVIGLAALGASTATAQTSAEARSRVLFDQARQLAEAKKWTEACPLFQAAHDLNSTGGTALQAANCYEQVGKLDRALALYQFILDNPEARKKKDRVALAEERIRAIREKLPAPPPPAESAQPPPATTPPPPATTPPPPATTPPPPATTPPPPATTPPPPVATTPPPVVTAPPPATAPPPVVTAPPPARSAAPEDTPAPSRVPMIAAFSVGGAGLIAGSIAGGLALSQAGDIKSRCSATECLASDQGNRDAALVKGWVSSIGFGVGIAGVAAGVVLLVTSKGGPKNVSADARGLVVRF